MLRDYRTGEIKQVKNYSSRSELASRVLRSELLDMLKNVIPKHLLHPGKRCVSLDQRDSTVHMTFADGSTAEADVVVGADGIHSVVRSKFYEDKPVFSGEVAYRALVNMADLKGVVDLDEFKEACMWLGPDKTRILTYPISTNGRILNIVGFFPPGPNENHVETYKMEGRPEEFMAVTEGWTPMMRKVLSKVEILGKLPLFDRNVLPRWTFGHITLLGERGSCYAPSSRLAEAILYTWRNMLTSFHRSRSRHVHRGRLHSWNVSRRR